MAENGDSGHPNEIAFSLSHVTKPMTKTIPAIRAASACIKPQRNSNMVRRGHVRYIQPTGQTLLAPHWSFMPGTYQGAEAGANF